jgi:hypothetical protein
MRGKTPAVGSGGEKAPAGDYLVVWETPLLGLACWRFCRLWLRRPWGASGPYMRLQWWWLGHAVDGDDDGGGAY